MTTNIIWSHETGPSKSAPCWPRAPPPFRSAAIPNPLPWHPPRLGQEHGAPLTSEKGGSTARSCAGRSGLQASRAGSCSPQRLGHSPLTTVSRATVKVSVLCEALLFCAAAALVQALLSEAFYRAPSREASPGASAETFMWESQIFPLQPLA